MELTTGTIYRTYTIPSMIRLLSKKMLIRVPEKAPISAMVKAAQKPLRDRLAKINVKKKATIVAMRRFKKAKYMKSLNDIINQVSQIIRFEPLANIKLNLSMNLL